MKLPCGGMQRGFRISPCRGTESGTAGCGCEIGIHASCGKAHSIRGIKMASRRKERSTEFNVPAMLTQSVSSDLLETVTLLLRQGLEQRRREVWRESKNHFTSFTPAVVVLIVTAFDQWVIECLLTVSCDSKARDLIEMPLRQRIPEMFQYWGKGLSPVCATDIPMLIDLRDEVVHYLPRGSTSQHGIPLWFRTLQSNGLLITSQGTRGDFNFYQKLTSYALGYWACETIAQAVDEVLAASPSHIRFILRAVAGNFRMFEHLTRPSHLSDYDAQFGLQLTRPPGL